MKYSVIIPVYNTKKELLKMCLESLINQKYNDVEYIVVDDGSSKETYNFLKENCNDKRIKLYHKTNSGVSAARNFGLSQSSGEYIMFVDSDDFIQNNFFQDIDPIVEANSFDILFFKHVNLLNNCEYQKTPISSFKIKKIDSLEISKLILNYLKKEPNIYFGTPWGKIIKHSLIAENNIQFPISIQKGEDGCFTLELLSHSPKCICVDYYGYYYVLNSSSLTHQFNPNISKIIFESYSAIKKVINEKYDYNSKRKLNKLLPYLKLNFMFDIFLMNFFNINNIKNKKERNIEFKNFLYSHKDFFKKIHISFKIPKGRNVFILLYKFHLYKIAFSILNFKYRK